MLKTHFAWMMLILISSTAPRIHAEETQRDAEPAKPVPLNKQKTVLLNRADKQIIVKTKVVLREGMLEMLLCKKQTKEHESILSVDADAYVIHSGLLALGAEAGKTVRYENEKFYPPTGEKLDIFAIWTDENDKIHRVNVKTWIRRAIYRFYVADLEALPKGVTLLKTSELRYDAKIKELYWYGPMTEEQRDEFLKMSDDKTFQAAIRRFFKESQPRQMDADWVFCGSGFYVVPDGPDKGKRIYQAESGDFICVANFATAMIDVGVESSASGSGNLLYEAWTERIPPKDTIVTLEIIPQGKSKKK
ncbi:YdjY domain-containing protein [Thalassoroseus pseudoceratinae]|uniref:YdjY domain-containing protein n=1 Tax=Thalassoroseus pseudoceratinae TaxID=2713176 RepID=UPI00141DC72F|nr:YdjY domain-containing protein [Thalassoroseus pseudoceratinae]